MVNWQITATTIYCEAVADEVTLMVYKDGAAKCTGQKKYGETGEIPLKSPLRQAQGRLFSKGGKRSRLGPKAKCEGSQCARATAYRDKLFAKEAGSKGRAAK